VLAVAGVAAMARGYGLVLAGLLARRPARQPAWAWHRPVCVGGAAALVALAVLALRPVIA
jgi:hypothetical protein